MPPELLESWLRAPQMPPELLESRLQAPQMPSKLLESRLQASPQTPLELLESSSESGFHAATRCLPQHTAQVALSSLPHSKETVQK